MESTPFNIPAHWTDEEALVVFEFIDEVREQIWNHYHLQIQAAAGLTQQVSSSANGPEHTDGQEGFGDDEIIF